MINENFFDTYDYTHIFEMVFKDHSIMGDDNHYGRHIQELKKKVDELKKVYKSKDYFKDMPTLDRDFSYYVISKF